MAAGAVFRRPVLLEAQVRCQLLLLVGWGRLILLLLGSPVLPVLLLLRLLLQLGPIVLVLQEVLLGWLGLLLGIPWVLVSSLGCQHMLPGGHGWSLCRSLPVKQLNQHRRLERYPQDLCTGMMSSTAIEGRLQCY